MAQAQRLAASACRRLAASPAFKAPQQQQSRTLFVSPEEALQKVREQQKKFGGPIQGADNPTYLKAGMYDKVRAGIPLGLMVIGLGVIGKGTYDMCYGVNKYEV